MLAYIIISLFVFPIGALIVTHVKTVAVKATRERQQKFLALPAVPGGVDHRQTADTERDLPLVVVRPRMTAYEGLPCVVETITLDLL